MRKQSILPMMMTAAALAFFSVTAPTAGFAAVNVQVSAYLPTPPGVGVYLGAGAPMYPEREQVIYVEKERKHKNKRRNKGKHWDEDRGQKNGHYK